ncbi:MAG: hypothetical protein GQ534_11965 [Candidatus Delongbacteria bacterium]|nr:hypothetical protein [Candidatus Delongbacteria bacterium]
MKKTLSILILLMMLSFLFAQEEESTEAIQDSLAVADTDSTIVIAEPVKELTEEEKLCKEVAEEFAKIGDEWDVTRDYNILLPRITGYAEDFFNSGKNPNIVLKEELEKVKTAISSLMNSGISETLENFLESNLIWIEKELSGENENPALAGHLSKDNQDKIKVIDDLIRLEGSENENIKEYGSDLQSAYKIVKRYTIDFDAMLDHVYAEVTRVSDKRVNFLYIEDDVQEKLKMSSKRLGDYVRGNKEKYLEEIDQDIDKAYQAKKQAEEEGDKEKIDKYHSQWLAAKAITIDNIYLSEITRLLGVVNKYRISKGLYDINAELISKLINKDPKFEEYFRNLLEIKFSQDVGSASKKYFRFDVDTGFRTYRTNVLIFTLLFFILFFYVFLSVRKNKDSIFIRRIPGLDAIDEAVGRATEMGKPIIYDSGLGGFTDPQTIASMLILRSVAKKVAEFKAEIIYPAYDPIVLQVAEEMIASGFLDAGYPEDHKKDNCFFLVQDQFAYAAGLSGLIARKKPATALHFGAYAAESLLISEAGFAAGAIQVAGTVAAAQLPFFITACDYTLIGEELYAAAAYLSRDAQILSNLKLSDYGKLVFGGLFVIATILLTINPEWTFIKDLLSTH